MGYLYRNDGVAECAMPWNKDSMVGISIPAAVRGHPIFQAQKDERHHGVHKQSNCVR